MGQGNSIFCCLYGTLYLIDLAVLNACSKPFCLQANYAAIF